MIGIIDYGAGNVASVRNAVNYLGRKELMITGPGDFDRCSSLIFPGQGSFGSMVDILQKRGLFERLYEYIKDGHPFLGVCLGLQVLYEGSEESPSHTGFGFLKGECTRFEKGKVPQIGWNVIRSSQRGFPEGFGYYVNSYRVISSEYAIATSDYYGEFVAAVQKENITAFQFHPEKSGKYGLSLLKWWFKCLQKE